MNSFEIMLLVMCLIIAISLIVFVISKILFEKKYRYFYNETEAGKRLISLRTTRQELQIDNLLLISKSNKTKVLIDDFKYLPETDDNRKRLEKFRFEYEQYSNEILTNRVKIAYYEIEINKTVNELPKKYKNILNYNWESFIIKE